MMRMVAVLLALGLGWNGALLAQACRGIPTVRGEAAVSFAVGAGVSFLDGRSEWSSTTYSLGHHRNPEGDRAYGFVYTQSRERDADGGTPHALGGNVMREAGSGGVSVCPTAGAFVLWMNGTRADPSETHRSLLIPLELGAGRRIELSESVAVTPWIMPRILWSWHRATKGDQSESASITDFGLAAGSALRFGSVYVQTTASLTVLEAATAGTFIIGGGYLF